MTLNSTLQMYSTVLLLALVRINVHVHTKFDVTSFTRSKDIMGNLKF